MFNVFLQKENPGQFSVFTIIFFLFFDNFFHLYFSSSYLFLSNNIFFYFHFYLYVGECPSTPHEKKNKNKQTNKSAETDFEAFTFSPYLFSIFYTFLFTFLKLTFSLTWFLRSLVKFDMKSIRIRTHPNIYMFFVLYIHLLQKTTYSLVITVSIVFTILENWLKAVYC